MGSRVAMAALVVSTVLMLSAVPMFFTGDYDGAPKTYDHIVTYDPNGGTGSMEDSVVTNSTKGGTPVELAANGFFREGYSFTGWDVKGVIYQPGDTVNVPSSKTATASAQWSENTLEASSEDFWAVSGTVSEFSVTASANNGAVLSYGIADPGDAEFSFSSDGAVTYTPSPAESTEIRQLEIEVTATFPDGQTMTAEVPLTVTVDPVFDFTNNPSDGTLAGEVVT